MTPEQEAAMFAPVDAAPAPTRQDGSLERVVITTADGQVFDLGNPSSILFKPRLWLYKRRRRHEGIANG